LQSDYFFFCFLFVIVPTPISPVWLTVWPDLIFFLASPDFIIFGFPFPRLDPPRPSIFFVEGHCSLPFSPFSRVFVTPFFFPIRRGSYFLTFPIVLFVPLPTFVSSQRFSRFQRKYFFFPCSFFFPSFLFLFRFVKSSPLPLSQVPPPLYFHSCREYRSFPTWSLWAF